MEKDEKKEGNWLNIPYEILMNPELDSTEKILLAEIQSLHKLEKGCFASNELFASLIGLKTASAASRRITRLTKMGYITTKNHYGNGNCVGRVITPTFKKAPDQSTVIEPGDSKGSSKRNQVVPEEQEGSSDWNQVVPEQQWGGSDTTRGVVPNEHGGSSDSTRGVVPFGQGGSSVRNTINTITNTEILKQEIRTDILEQATSTDTGDENNRLAFIFSQLKELEEIKPVLSMKEYAVLMDRMFAEEKNWRNDLLECGIAVFIKIMKHCHLNDEANISIIKCYFKLQLEKHLNSSRNKKQVS